MSYFPLSSLRSTTSCLSLALLVFGCQPKAAETAEAVPEAQVSLAEHFADPPMEARPRFRWWWPHGLVDPAQIRAEVAAMAEAGFGGAEIADVHHSVREPLAPETHGWGTGPWVEAVQAAFEEAVQHDFEIDLTLGPSWPVALPTVDPNHPLAMQELAHGKVLVEAGATYRGPAPAAIVKAHGKGVEETLLLLQAAQLAPGADPEEKEVTLVPGSVVEVALPTDGADIVWTAPAEGRWFLLSYWQRGSSQRPEGGPHTEPDSYVVDHFNPEASQAVIDFWETRILTPELRDLLRQAGGAFFEDSIEMETKATLWTPGLLKLFEERKGYSLLPYLPIIVQRNEDPVFRFEGDIAAHVEHDWWALIGELFIEAHLKPLQEWAHTYGMGLRAQPYGMPTDAVSAAAYLDISEGESLGFKNLDDFRSLAGGRDMGGHRVLSDEAGAFAGGAYSTTWKRMLSTLNPIFAAGVNQSYLHGFAYRDVPGVAWPGFAAFSPYGGYPGYAEAWGPRQPSWRHVRGIADYFGRVQWALQAGEPQVDVAFLRQKGYAGSGFGAPWLSKEGTELGWTHNFISPANLELPRATVRDGLLAPDGPAYRALVFEGDAFHRRESTMPVATARRILALAEAGLPMVVVGDWSAPNTSGLAQTGEREALAKIFAKLLALPSVHNAPDRSKIGEGLEALGLEPRVRHAQSPFQHAIRQDGDGRFVFFVNQGKEAARTAVALETFDGAEALYRLNPWSGAIEPVASTLTADGTWPFEVELAAGSTALYWLGAEFTNSPSAAEGMPPSEGSTPSALTLTSWTLEVEDWRPGGAAAETVFSLSSRKLDALASWTEIPGLEDVSGIGTYRTVFTLEEGWAPFLESAVLDLGATFDTVVLRLNGVALSPVDPLDPRVSLAPALRLGSNTLEVEVSTTLNNRLRTASPDVFGANQRQAYGLLGPVVLRPSTHPLVESTP